MLLGVLFLIVLGARYHRKKSNSLWTITEQILQTGIFFLALICEKETYLMREVHKTQLRKRKLYLKKKSIKENTKDLAEISTNVILLIIHLNVLILFASELSNDTRCHMLISTIETNVHFKRSKCLVFVYHVPAIY